MRSYLGTSNINNTAPWVHGAHTKYEEVYLKAYTTPREAELEIGHYMVFYNEERNHQGLNDLTPDEAYFGRQRYAA
ncbi:hypothetical protein M892_28325 (plasmid) [Vibrio campbellii ATCC BAA-1116]|uniref:Uncharacterized protein n=1 Tax=Vibrio campbellii (strain ATCC BAA-1116) TaxID=2902295 RepID=A7N8X6_VIBC1|nr:hypothetical protein VIBHAR_p08177 [Vibrio campbellii ATCC BAA-1116]AGU99036.1 hypothetical protein M892_28325 [Vibrio campbellii ATCC BAA-1116]